jgi:DNA-binding GntR family transcriptional regulator
MPSHEVERLTGAIDSRSSSKDLGRALKAYTFVHQRIIRGELAPGETISRRKIAAELGISFGPASEALLRLEWDGLLESRPRAGTRPRIPTKTDVQGHLVIREALEVQAARMFAENATAREKTELTKLAGQLDKQSQGPDYPGLHESLHLRIAECTRCGALHDAIAKASAMECFWLATMRLSTPSEPSADHKDLLKWLSAKSPAFAAEAMRTHIQSSMQDMALSLEPYFDLHDRYENTYSRPRRPQAPEVAEETVTSRFPDSDYASTRFSTRL